MADFNLWLEFEEVDPDNWDINQIPSDLLVKELTRNCIEKTITDLMKKGNLEDILNPTVLDIEE